MPVLVNADTRIQIPGGGWITAEQAAASGNASRSLDGRVFVNDDTIMQLPGGGTMRASALGTEANPGTGAASQPKPPSVVNGDAFAQLRQYLAQYGLEALTGTVEGWMQEGISTNEALLRLYQTPEFKAAFPEIDEYRRRGHPGALTPGAIIEYRQRFTQEINRRGLTEAFPDIRQAAFEEMAVRNRSLAEVGARFDLLEGNVAAMAAQDPQTQADLEAWERFYGQRPTLGNLVSLALNPNEALPALQRKFSAVKLDVVAGRAGFGDLERGEAERIADSGITAQDAEQRFNTLTTGRELYEALDSGEDQITRTEQLDAGFSNNAAAQKRIADRARRRTAAFQGGGGLATSREGYAGLSTGQ